MIDDFQIALAVARARPAGNAFARRYGGHCTTCGVVRDYHNLGNARDHAFNEPRREDPGEADHMPTVEDNY